MSDENVIEPVGGEPTSSPAAPPAGQPAGGQPTPSGTGAPTTAPSPSPTPPPAAAAGDPIKAAEDRAAADEVAKTKHLNLTQEQLNDRISQAKRAAAAIERSRLREVFGTDDLAEIKKIREEHAQFKTEAEKQARERMTREQQLETDLKTAREETQALRDQLVRHEADRAYEKQDGQVRTLAGKHIAEDLIDDVIHIFARSVVNGMSEEDAANLDDAKIERWFADFAKKKGAFARTQPAAPAPEKKEEARKVEKKPITNGVPRSESKPTPNTTTDQVEKTPRPGQPNSMNKGEYAAFLRTKGLQY